MPEPLKDLLNRQSLSEFATAIKSEYPSFSGDDFLTEVLSDPWDNLELKARWRHLSTVLGKYLPSDYQKALAIIDRVIVKFQGLCLYCFPDFIEVYGQDEVNWDASLAAMARYTPYASCELVIRSFIIKDEKRLLTQMLHWAHSENEHLRRLASEGCRPQLPWAQALESFKADPQPLLPILEQLKNDPSAYVRKSVANNLNDISKTHPDFVLKIVKDWYGKSKNTDWILKHGCRGLLKQGNGQALAIFGFTENSSINISGLRLNPTKLAIGDSLTFSFTIHATGNTKVRLEYAIGFIKANGSTRRKVFQISEINLKENENRTYCKTHSFANLSVRKHYPGQHHLTLIVNGKSQESILFQVT